MKEQQKKIDNANKDYLDSVTYSWNPERYFRHTFDSNAHDFKFKVLKEFEINKYISLKLINCGFTNLTQTQIFLNDQVFLQCAYILVENPQEPQLQSEIDSIDEAAEILDSRLEMSFESDSLIPPETLFWAHCSNLQAWCEFNYDTRLLHSNLSFPLLKELYKLGDLRAKKVFKEEIAVRLLSQYPPVISYLIIEGYLKYFSEEELESIFFKLNEQLNLPNPRLVDKSLIETLDDRFSNINLMEFNSEIKYFVQDFVKKLNILS